MIGVGCVADGLEEAALRGFWVEEWMASGIMRVMEVQVHSTCLAAGCEKAGCIQESQRVTKGLLELSGELYSTLRRARGEFHAFVGLLAKFD